MPAFYLRLMGANGWSISGASIWSYQIKISLLFDNLTIELRDGKILRFAIPRRFSQDFDAALSRLLDRT